MEIGLELNTNQLLKAYHLFPKHLEVELRDALDHAGRKFLKEFYNRRLTQAGSDRVQSRGRGGLFRTFVRLPIKGQGLDISQEIVSESKVAKIWEEGGDRKGRGRIAVPLQFRGSDLYTGGKYRRIKKQFRDVSALTSTKKFFYKRINGQVYLVRRKDMKPYFVLKNKVTVQPRLGYYGTFEEMNTEFIKIYNKSFDRAATKGGW